MRNRRDATGSSSSVAGSPALSHPKHRPIRSSRPPAPDVTEPWFGRRSAVELLPPGNKVAVPTSNAHGDFAVDQGEAAASDSLDRSGVGPCTDPGGLSGRGDRQRGDERYRTAGHAEREPPGIPKSGRLVRSGLATDNDPARARRAADQCGVDRGAVPGRRPGLRNHRRLNRWADVAATATNR